MKVKVRKKTSANRSSVEITGPFIRLDALLKYSAMVATGGEAKIAVQSGAVFLNGEACLQRGKKIVPGDVVRFGSNEVEVKADSAPVP